jgi:hypothetical protein
MLTAAKILNRASIKSNLTDPRLSGAARRPRASAAKGPASAEAGPEKNRY